MTKETQRHRVDRSVTCTSEVDQWGLRWRCASIPLVELLRVPFEGNEAEGLQPEGPGIRKGR